MKLYAYRHGNIEHARESECRLFVSKVTSLVQDKWLCSQARAIINRVVDYFVWSKMCSGGHSLLKERWKPPVSDRNGLSFKTLAFLKPGFSESHKNMQKMSTKHGTI